MTVIPTKGVQKYLKLDGVVMPTPSEYEFTEADFDSADSTRSETGVLIRKRIRRGVHTVLCRWSAISTENLRKIMNAVKTEKLNVSVFDPLSTAADHMTTYTGYAQTTRKAKIVIPRYNPDDTLWSYECSFIEY